MFAQKQSEEQLICFFVLETSENQHRGRHKKLSEAEQVLLLDIIFDNPGIYLDELKELLMHRTGISVSIYRS